VDWVHGTDAEPITVYEPSFDASRLLTLRTRNSAAYKGIYALLMVEGCKDWLDDHDITMANHHQLAVDIYHIFPKAWCNANGIDDLRRESIVNKTAISAATNRIIGWKKPSTYIKQLAENGGVPEASIREYESRAIRSPSNTSYPMTSTHSSTPVVAHCLALSDALWARRSQTSQAGSL
jgi:hypothetical protein